MLQWRFRAIAHVEVIEFGDFRFEPATPLLTRNSRSIELPPRALEILAVLVDKAGQVVSKDDLLSLVWREEIVEESNLAVYISALRKAFGRGSLGDAYIETVPKRGYRFAASVRRVPSIAVLPFDNLSSDEEHEYFAEGLAEEIINSLSRIPTLKVIARTSAFSFKGEQDRNRIATTLGVDHLVLGSVRVEGDRLRTIVKLLALPGGRQLWSQRFDQQMTGLFQMQEEIAHAIATSLQLKLLPTRRPTMSVEAYHCCLKAFHHYQRLTASDMTKAKEYAEEAIRHDPQYALPYAGLALYYQNPQVVTRIPPEEAVARSEAALRKAIQLDPTMPEAHCILAQAAIKRNYDWNTAEREFRIAIASESVSVFVRLAYADWFLTHMHRFEEAFEQYRIALEADPLSGLLHVAYVDALYAAGDPDGALKHAATVRDMCSLFWGIPFTMGMAQMQKELLDAAASSFEQTILAVPMFGPAVGMLAACYTRLGKHQQGEGLIHGTGDQPISRAIYCALLGESERLFVYLDEALERSDDWLLHLVSGPIMKPHRSDARCRPVLRRMNLEFLA
jgi:TolB-like protein